MARLFDAPYAPARAAVQALVQPRTPGAKASEAQTLITHIVARLNELGAAGQPVPSAEADELHAHVERVIELVLSMDPAVVPDADERKAHAEARGFVIRAFELALGNLDM